MRLHRFYIDPKIHRLKNKFWLQDRDIVSQWQRVLRYKVGQKVVLFDGEQHERLYKITKFEPEAVDLELVTEMTRKLPSKDIYLAWALLKKDKNEWVVQKCTELGVNHFIPIMADRSEKTGFNEERANKIAIEAAEQCGRGNIPKIREPITLETLIDEFSGKVQLLVCEQEGQKIDTNLADRLVVMVGPEGGWSDDELQLFKDKNVAQVNIGDFTHRAETASVAAISKLL